MGRRRLVDLAIVAILIASLYAIYQHQRGEREAYGVDLYRVEASSLVPLGARAEIALRGVKPDRYEWRGELVTPRCGRYRFYAYGAGTISLELDGRELEAAAPPARDAAHFAERGARLAAGVHALRLRFRPFDTSPARLRLMWNAGVSAAGPRPIPATLLRREGQAPHPRAYELAPWRSLGAALAIAALALAALLWLRAPIRALFATLRREAWARQDLASALALFLCAALVRSWGLVEAAPLPDEEQLVGAARAALALLSDADLSPLSWSWARGLPLGGVILYAPAALFDDALAAGRVIAALLGAATAAMIFVAGRELMGRGIAFVAALLFSFLPAAVALGRQLSSINTLLLCYVLAVWCFWRGCRLWRAWVTDELESPTASRRAFVATSVFAGIGVATSLAALSLVGVLAVLFASSFGAWRLRAASVRLPAALVWLPGLTLVVFWAVQPALWGQPLTGIAELLLAASREGGRVEARDPILWLVATTPLWTLPLALIGGLRALGLLGRREGVGVATRRRRAGAAVALLWLVSVLGAATLAALSGWQTAEVWRASAPALLALALLAASGADVLARGAARALGRDRSRLPAFALAAGVASLALLADVVRFHPYLAAYDAGVVGRAPDHLRVAAAHQALPAALHFVGHRARPNERVALGFAPVDAVAACTPTADETPLRGRDDVFVVPWSARSAATWLIERSTPAPPHGYRRIKTIGAAGRGVLELSRRIDDE